MHARPVLSTTDRRKQSIQNLSFPQVGTTRAYGTSAAAHVRADRHGTGPTRQEAHRGPEDVNVWGALVARRAFGHGIGVTEREVDQSATQRGGSAPRRGVSGRPGTGGGRETWGWGNETGADSPGPGCRPRGRAREESAGRCRAIVLVPNRLPAVLQDHRPVVLVPVPTPVDADTACAAATAHAAFVDRGEPARHAGTVFSSVDAAMLASREQHCGESKVSRAVFGASDPLFLAVF